MTGTTTPRPIAATHANRAALPQYSLAQILALWAAAAAPMAILAWLAAPWIAHGMSGPTALPRALILMLTAGLGWQFVPRTCARPPRAGLAAVGRREGRAVAACAAPAGYEPAWRAGL